MGSQSEKRTRFPFLSLEPELQAEVVQHVGDLVALRDLLAIPQVVESVGPCVRLVTNGEKPLWFRGLEKHALHINAPRDLVNNLTRSSKGVVYIVDLDYSLYRGPEMYAFLRMPIVVFTVENSQDDEDEYPVSEDIEEFVSMTGTQNLGIIAATESCSIYITADDGPLSPNLTLVDFHSVYASAAEDPMGSQNPLLFPPIRFAGALSSLVLENVPPHEDGGPVVYDRYKELIKSADSVDISPDSRIGGDSPKEFTLCGWEIPQLIKESHIYRCFGLFDLNINTWYTDETANVVKDGELSLEMSYPYRTNKEFKPPEIRHVVAAGLRKLTIETFGPFFPVMESLWFPHLETLKLTGFNEFDSSAIRFDHLGTRDLEEVSRLLHGVKYLHLDQFIVPLLGYLAPFALENVTTLTLEEHVPQGFYHINHEEVETLKVRHAKIRLPKLKELRWSSMCENEEKILDFTQFSKWFICPRLRLVVFATPNESISLKDIAYQTPRIKTLKITEPELFDYDLADISPGLYPTPDRNLPRYVTFERLENLVVHTGYHSSVFEGILFPRLKSLDLFMALQNVKETTLQAKMPVLEELVITVTSNPEPLGMLGIGDFGNLRKLALSSDAEELCFMHHMTKLEEVTHKGKGLKVIAAKYPASFEKLKILKYSSLSGRACHNPFANPSLEVDLR